MKVNRASLYHKKYLSRFLISVLLCYLEVAEQYQVPICASLESAEHIQMECTSVTRPQRSPVRPVSLATFLYIVFAQTDRRGWVT